MPQEINNDDAILDENNPIEETEGNDNQPESLLPEGERNPEEELSAKESALKEYMEKEKRWEVEKELMEKRIKDTQNEFHKKRDGRGDEDKPKETDQQQGETLDQYTQRLIDMLADDPAKAVSQLVKDIAQDKYISEQKFHGMLQEAEERAYQRALRADPTRAEMFKKVEALEEERPDLANLTFEQKFEFVKLLDGGVKPEDKTDQIARRGQEILTGTRRGSSRKSGLPDWTEDPEIQRDAKDFGFSSRAELKEYANKVFRGDS